MMGIGYLDPLACDTPNQTTALPLGRRLLAALLAFVLALSLIPSQALAAGEGEGSVDVPLTVGTCEYTCDNAGNLVIRPSDGSSGVIDGTKGFPWVEEPELARLVNRVQVMPGVTVKGTCKGMFQNLPHLRSVDLSGLALEGVTDLSNMFSFAPYSETIQGEVISYDESLLETVTLPAEFETCSVTTTASMFAGCKNLTTVANMNFDISGVSSAKSMFDGCENLGSSNTVSYSIPNARDISSMFKGCRNLYSVELGNIKGISGASSLFEGCNNLTSLTLSGSNSSTNLNLASAFKNCGMLGAVDLSPFRGCAVSFLDSTFEGCFSLGSLALPQWDTANVSKFSDLFNGCANLRLIDGLGNLDTRSATAFDRMFCGAESLRTIQVSRDRFVIQGDATTTDMFKDCKSLIGGYGFEYYEGCDDGRFACFDSPTTPGFLTDLNQPIFPKGGEFDYPEESSPVISFSPIGTQFYTGKQVRPQVDVEQGSYRLKLGEDFSVSYQDNIQQGTAKAIVTGLGGYSGTHVIPFEILRPTIDSYSVKLDQSSFDYVSGGQYKPIPTVFLNGEPLVSEADYTYEYEGNDKPGTGYVVVTILNPLLEEGANVIRTPFTIAGKPIASNSILIEGCIYDGTPQVPGIAIRKPDGNYLVLGQDYTVSCSNNVAPGTGTATITGIGEYAGTITRTFIITGPLAKASYRLSASTFTYDGKAKAPGVTVTLGGKVLRAGTDYAVSYSNNVRAGKATVLITGKGVYTGAAKVLFNIVPCNLSKAKLTGLVSKAYTKRAIKQVPTVKVGALTLKSGTDFTVAYKNNKKLGKATVTVTGKGNFTGSKKGTFKIVRYKQPMTAKAVAKTAKLATVKKKAVSVNKVITVKKAKGKVTYTNVSTSAAAKKFKVNAKKATITVPKGTKKGTYKVKVKVEAAGSGNYAYGSKNVTVTIKVK